MKKQIQILIALLALSFALYGQSDRVKTVEVPDSASMIVFDNTDTEYNETNVQSALEELDFDAGNILYVATTGDDATGVIGYPNKPFTPIEVFDNFQNRLWSWWYPGTYNIGPGQEFNYGFTNTGTPPPVWFYAPNSKISIIETGSQDYVFKVTSTRQTDTTTYLNIGELSLYDIAFLRNSEALNDGRKMYVNGKIRTLQFINPDSGGDAFYVGANSTWEIDSISGSGQIAYCEPRDNDRNIFNINSIYIDQTPYPAKKTNAFVSATLWNTRAINPYFELNVGRFYCKNCPPVFYNYDAGILSTGAKDIINIENLILSDTTQRVDTIPSATISLPTNNTNQIAGIYWGFKTNSNSGYSSQLDINELSSDKTIGIVSCSDSFNISVNVENGTFSQTRAVVIQSITNDNAKININSNFLCRKSNVISVLSTDNTTDITISGRHETQQPRQPVIYAAQNITLENVELVNDGATPAILAPTPITVYVRGNLYMNSDIIHPNVTFVKIDYGYTNPTNIQHEDTQTILDSLFQVIPKQSATIYQSTLRQYTFTQDTITIDTLSNALMTDSITQDTGYIRNISSDTMRWQVSYNFFRDSDEDALTSFMDITTDGGDIPEAIPGSRAYSEQAVTNGTQHAGPTFTVDVPPGAALRLCVYSISAAAGVDISDMTISVEEIYRE